MQDDLVFSSRRSPVICLNGCVASSQPLASNIGLEILKSGGNAADAAVAVAAALNVTEPTSTGIGGDAFCLFYDAASRQVRGLNGSGRSPKAQTLELMEACGFSQSNPPPYCHAFNVTVPGAAACWCDTVNLFGSKKLSLADVLQPAIDLAQNGFPVAEITAYQWAEGAKSLRAAGRELGGDLLINNQPPKHGQVMTNPNLARTFQELVLHGRKGFYQGRIAQAVVDVVQENGGVMSLYDMKNHVTAEITPIYIDYKTVRVWEVPPNSQGMAALIALNILQSFPIKDMVHNSADYLHTLVESLKLSMTDTMHFSTDPDKMNVPVEGLLSKDYALQRAQFIQMDKARSVCEPGIPTGSDTVYFTVVDKEGNACSFVNSNYMGFGTGLVPRNCGFSLQNRGANFSLDSNHVNCIGPEKRPYHTIIPAMLTDPLSGRLLCSFGVMGGFMQPQGHVQVLLNMVEFGMNPQRALDAPRVFVSYDQAARLWQLNLEAGMDRGVADELRRRGHAVNWPVKGHERDRFGRGQMISIGKWWWDLSDEKPEGEERVLWAGSDPRADGCAVGY
ncbi:glutathione hydrolase-like YwrD proenzyme isoform X2 [Ictalurus punctatus]|nr:glutathione hydrolase-like YwrD proenzyme isoform X2 [Ictalurus punctatus]XP_047014082.2 glutathione hydrolase-like YwrD proenzyme isoform X2 [Ictalurus punctatus]XP_047014083.2 glutathione hydrolase-like YwrD proenzyme isoform X2 [Ictalurus punctatus]XP_047014085.1 glutathione hydrolase-like YwrD proenzyme isoform X2 [Ictalurus punctatus]XP_047014086.1 glutathione hydrolase-like YwrD proenzyme isoform X2 [Ictalurus punctatus]XP_047014087.1 glutathione hydrolase-like YwrD proenzyme isoform 